MRDGVGRHVVHGEGGTVRARGEDILVVREGVWYAQEASASGLVIPDVDVDRAAVESAVVVSVGPEVREELADGDRVLIGRYGGDEEFEVAGVEYTRCGVTDILAKLR